MKSIRNNKDLFDDQELPEGHIERFEALLDKQDKSRNRTIRIRLITTIASIAACIAILVFIGVKYNGMGKEYNNMTPNLMQSKEFVNLNNFYKHQMDEQITKIMCKLEHADDETSIALKHDIEKIISENRKFVEDISKSEDQELALFYVTQHYDRNLEVLNYIDNTLGSYFKC